MFDVVTWASSDMFSPMHWEIPWDSLLFLISRKFFSFMHECVIPRDVVHVIVYAYIFYADSSGMMSSALEISASRTLCGVFPPVLRLDTQRLCCVLVLGVSEQGELLTCPSKFTPVFPHLPLSPHSRARGPSVLFFFPQLESVLLPPLAQYFH